MNRQDLIAFSQRESRRQIRRLFAILAFCAIWMGALFFYAGVILDDLGVPVFLVAAAVPIVALVAMAVRVTYSMPKCPHCGIRLMGWLLPMAISSGNCGRCGRSIDN
jgi:hypothetical protein